MLITTTKTKQNKLNKKWEGLTLNLELTYRHHVFPRQWNTTQADSSIHCHLGLFVPLTNLMVNKRFAVCRQWETETAYHVQMNFTAPGLLPQHTPELHISCVTMYLVFLQGCTLPTYTLVPGPNGKLVNYFIWFHYLS